MSTRLEMRQLLDQLRASADALRRDLQEDYSEDLQRRRGIIALSLAGMASMATVSLLQGGLVSHLPDPPVEGFDSDKVNLSEEAYQFGVPDGTVALASMALNVPLASMGGSDRVHTTPWIPLLAAGKAAVEAVGSSWYFYQMPAQENAWCGYCITGAVASLGVFGLTIPEARTAWRALRDAA